MRARDEKKEVNIRREATKMIVNEGFKGLSMQKLARKAGLSVSTIYIYFKNREDLLNKLYIHVQDKFEKDVLENFREDLDFGEGLWLQWKNRFQHITKNPMEFQFYEQFRNSPLINHKDIKPAVFRKAMNDFVDHAIRQGQIKNLSPEIFWAIAYGPFYTMIKFHLTQATMAGKPFALTEKKLRQVFDLVLSALKK